MRSYSISTHKKYFLISLSSSLPSTSLICPFAPSFPIPLSSSIPIALLAFHLSSLHLPPIPLSPSYPFSILPSLHIPLFHLSCSSYPSIPLILPYLPPLHFSHPSIFLPSPYLLLLHLFRFSLSSFPLVVQFLPPSIFLFSLPLILPHLHSPLSIFPPFLLSFHSS